MRHRLLLAGIMRPDPASFIFCTGDTEVIMEDSKKISQSGLRMREPLRRRICRMHRNRRRGIHLQNP